MSETLLYAQVPRFYAEVERAADPGLVGRPVIVGGDPRKRGVVHSASEDALAAGVAAGMPVLDALERCPRARVLPTDMRRYREVAACLRACFREVTDRVERVGLDAAYLALPAGADAPEDAARALQRRVRETLDLPLRVGIAPVKLLARLAAEEAGEEGIRRIRAAEVERFLAPLLVTRLPGVGPNTVATLAALGVHRVGELRGLERRRLEERLGNHGLTILAYAEGNDVSRLRASPHPRSLSQECTLDADESDRSVLEDRLAWLAERLERSLDGERLCARRVTLKLRYADLESITRTRTLTRPLHAAGPIGAVGSELLARTQAGERPVRGIGLALGGLASRTADDAQLELFSGS